MKKLMLDVVVCLFFLAHWAPVSAAQAALDEKAVADFYRGKTVTLLVGHSAGGGFDTYARMIGRYLGKYVPGIPNVIVTNMPGAGTMISVNHMYNSGARDGTLINSFDGGIVTQQLYKTSGVKFDLNKLFYLGAPDSFLYVMAVTKQSGVTKFDEILGTNAKEVGIGAVRNVLGGKVKVVSGYKGTAEIRMAMKSGEVDSVITDWGSLRVTNSPDFESGEWLIFVQLTEKPIEDLPQKNVWVGPYSSSNYPITGPGSAPCRQYVYYSIPALEDVISINWVWPSSWTYVSGQGTRYIALQTGATGSGGIIGAQAVNICLNPGSYATMYTSVTGICGYSLSVSPNPATGEATIELVSDSNETLAGGTEWELEVYDSMQGLKEKKTKITGNQAKINTANWKDGVYIVRAKIGDEVITEKLVVKH